MTTLCDPAEFQRISLLLGINSIEDVIQWADGEILRLDTFPDALIEISLGRSLSKYEIQTLLCSLVVVHNGAALKRALTIMSTAIQDGLMAIDTAINNINYFLSFGHNREEFYNAFKWLVFEMEDIEDGISNCAKDISDLRKPLLNALEAFCN